MLKGFISMIIGITATSALLGYLTGASSDAMASTIAVGVTTLITTTFGLITIKNTSNQPNVDIDKETNRILMMTGITLLFICVGFNFGAFRGNYERTHGVFNTFLPERSLPWENDSVKPPTHKQALSWIKIQEQLLARGYTAGQVQQIYSLRVNTWQRNEQKDKYKEDIINALKSKKYTLEQSNEIYNIFSQKGNFSVIDDEEEISKILTTDLPKLEKDLKGGYALPSNAKKQK